MQNCRINVFHKYIIILYYCNTIAIIYCKKVALIHEKEKYTRKGGCSGCLVKDG